MIRLWLRLTCLLLVAALLVALAVARFEARHPAPLGPQVGYGVQGGFTFTSVKP